MKKEEKLLCLGLAVSLGVSRCGAETSCEPIFDLGPLASRYVDVTGTDRLRALGPFFEWARSREGDTLSALRPFTACARQKEGDRWARDLLWPLGGVKRFREEGSCRIAVAYAWRERVADPRSRYRFWLLPIYFQGRDAEGEEYRALFPLGGRIHEFLGQDRIAFVLFPLWSAHSVGEVRTHGWLWPIYSRTAGKGIRRFRIFPFYGYSRHRDLWEKRFILWPIWTHARYERPRSAGEGYILFPLWGHLRLANQEGWLFLPPFFQFQRGPRMKLICAPWPFFQRSRGEIEKFYVFPLYGRKHLRGVTTAFYVWPVLWREKREAGGAVRSRFLVLPFWYAEAERERQPGAGGAQAARSVYWKLWPLACYQRSGEHDRLRLLALWPLKDSPPVERSWAPLWTLYEARRAGDAAETEVLWGLYRHRRRGAGERYVSVFPLFAWHRKEDGGDQVISIFRGLLAYERQGGRRRVGALYFFWWGSERPKGVEPGARRAKHAAGAEEGG